MKIYSKIRIENFRCFERIELDDLTDFNLFVGKNASGKSSFLEAVFIHSGMNNPELLLRIHAFRGLNFTPTDALDTEEAPWRFAFHNFNTKKQISVDSVGHFGRTDTRLSVPALDEKLNVLVQIRNAVPSFPPFSVEALLMLKITTEIDDEQSAHYLIITHQGYYVYPMPTPPGFKTVIILPRTPLNPQQIAETFSRVAQYRESFELLIEILKAFEPHLEDLRLFSYPAQAPTIHASLSHLRRPLPVSNLSEGFSRALEVILTVLSTSGGVVLIDELENGIHYSVYDKYFANLLDLSKKLNVQIFATTHSYECIIAYHKVTKDSGTDARVIRLEPDGGRVRVVSYTKEDLPYALEMGLEIR